MVDTSAIRKKLAKKHKTIKSIDEMIDAGNEYVVVDDFEHVKGSKYDEPEKPAVIFHDAQSDIWFWGAGKDIEDYVKGLRAVASEEEIAGTFAERPELWLLSKVIQVKDYKNPNRKKSYRPTKFLGYASDFEDLGKKMGIDPEELLKKPVVK